MTELKLDTQQFKELKYLLSRLITAIEANNECNLRHEQHSLEQAKRCEARDNRTLELHELAANAVRASHLLHDMEE
jgi:hypothetical protein